MLDLTYLNYIFFSDIIYLTIFLFILFIIKYTKLLSNISIKNFSLYLPINNTFSNQEYRQKLANFLKIHIDKVKYSNKNNSFLYKLIIFYNIYVKIDIL